MRHIRRAFPLRMVAYALVLAVLLAFPYGPLFPWSPVTPGYQRVRFARADVLYPSGTTPGEWVAHVDDYIRDAERFHRFAMPDRVSIILCRSWRDFARFMPVISGDGPGAVTLGTGTVIYVTPKLDEKSLDKGEYVRHELAHAVVHQNQGLLVSLRVRRQQWLYDGIAVCFGRQESYVTPEEFVERTLREDLVPVIDPDRRAQTPQPADMRFSYQAWRYFLEHLIQTQGRERFLRFFAACAPQPEAAPVLFSTAYGLPLPEAIRRFQSDVCAGKWRPDPSFLDSHM